MALKGHIPWNKGLKIKPLSQEQKVKLSQIAKEKGFGLWMIGKKLSQETKRKMSKSHKGKSAYWNVGKPVWNKGKTKKDYPQLGNSGAKKGISSKLKGRKFPERCGINNLFFGKHHSEENKRKISEAQKNRIGYKHSEETKKKISLAQKGKSRLYMIGFKFSKESKEKMRQVAIRKLQNSKWQNTSIELKIEQELRNRKINYQKQVSFYDQMIVDFYLSDYNIIIECDGDYWHTLPGAQEKDERKTKLLLVNGHKVFRFWEHEINKSSKECVDRIFK